MSIRKAILIRVRVAFLVMAIVALVIIIKISHLQFVEGGYWRAKMAKRYVQFRHISAQRGSIYADDGSLMATSLPFYKIAIDPTVPSNEVFKNGIDSLSMLLASTIEERTQEEYKELITNARKKKRRYIPLSSHSVDYQIKKQIETFPILRKGQYQGGKIIEIENRRFTPFGMMAGRTIGYVNKKNKGVVGLEYSFDKYLSGKNGQALFRYIGNNTWKPSADGSAIEPINGLDIYTTIDVNVQDIAHGALLKALISNDADYGCTIVMEVKTGEIKAISNLGKIRDGVYAEDYNYAIGSKGSQDPGSTFKLASMMALLEENAVDPNEKVETGEGSYKFYNTPLNDPKRGGFGTITAQQVFEKSSNIGIAKLVERRFKDDPQRFVDYMEQFGLNTPLHFQLVGETTPYIKNVNDPTWSVTTLPWMSIGYETKISPLQMLTLYNTVANGGKMIQPILVKAIKSGDHTIENFRAVTLKERVCSPQTIQKVTKMLEGVVQRGTAKAINTPQYRIAGKTSTAQKLIGGKYTKSYRTAFAGFFPADHPKYSCIVVIDNPMKEKQYGGDVAAPVFRKIADRLYANDLRMHSVNFLKTTDHKRAPQSFVANKEDALTLAQSWGFKTIDHGKKDQNPNMTWIRSKALRDRSLSLKDIKIKKHVMPDVRGMTLRDAIFILENHGCKVKYKGKGKVTSQSIKPGLAIKRGRLVVLKLKG